MKALRNLGILIIWAIPALAPGALGTPQAAPIAVNVRFQGPQSDAAVPVEFTLPLGPGAFEANLYLVDAAGGKGRYLCQARPASPAPLRIAPEGEGPATTGFVAARVTALLPRRDGAYFLVSSRERLGEREKVVSSAEMGTQASMDGGGVHLEFNANRLSIIDAASVGGTVIIPQYVEKLINRQQALELIVTDRFRHADFTLRAGAKPLAARPLITGPVVGTAVYDGVFQSAGGVEEIKFRLAVSLAADGLVRVGVAFGPGAFDPERIAVKGVRITLPLVLADASALSFGGSDAEAAGRAFWKGGARLAASGGSYEFADGDGARIRGKSAVSYADYGDNRAGMSVIWGDSGLLVEVAVDFTNDVVDVTLSPDRAAGEAFAGTGGEASIAEAEVFLLLRPGARDRARISALAETISRPAEVTIDAGYLKAAAKPVPPPQVSPVSPVSPAQDPKPRRGSNRSVRQGRVFVVPR